MDKQVIMKKSLLILTTLLIAWDASAQWNIKGTTVYKQDQFENFAIRSDSLNRDYALLRLKPKQKIEFLVNFIHSFFSKRNTGSTTKEIFLFNIFFNNI